MKTYVEKKATNLAIKYILSVGDLAFDIDEIISDVKRGCIKEVKYGSHGYNVIGAIEDAEPEEE